MVKRPLSPRDLELLSAYLDRQLSTREQQQLEERMRSNPGLQSALIDLRRTKVMLRSLPKVRAPRNFTLSPAMVPARRREMFFGMPLKWSAASALSTLLLFLFFVGDLLGLFSPRLMTIQTAQRASDSQALETAMSQIDQQAKVAGETPETGFNMPVAPENERGMGGGGGPESESAIQVTPALLGTPQISADQYIIVTTPTPSAFDTQPMLEMASPSTITETLAMESAPGEEETFIPPTDQAAVPAEAQSEADKAPPVLFTPWWVRVIEVALLLAALGAGVFAFTRRAR